VSSHRDAATARRRAAALAFRLHAAVVCPPHADLAASLAAELGDLDADRLERDLCALAAAVGATAGCDPAAQLRALGAVVASGALAARRHGGAEELLIDRVLAHGHGHPLLVAVVLAEIGRRANLPVGIVGGAHGHYVAHPRLTEARLLDPWTGALVDAEPLGALTWRCGHQLAASLLDVLQPRYERAGDLSRALHVARMRCSLPFDDAARETARGRLGALAARLN
jgi:hypothetical protein